MCFSNFTWISVNQLKIVRHIFHLCINSDFHPDSCHIGNCVFGSSHIAIEYPILGYSIGNVTCIHSLLVIIKSFHDIVTV